MNYIQLFYLTTIFFVHFLSSIDQQAIPETILTPIPLLNYSLAHHVEEKFLPYLKQSTIPITAFFYYIIHINSVMTDIIKNPLTTITLISMISYYVLFMETQKKEEKIHKEIIDMMEEVFQILIISHGIYNKITFNEVYQTTTKTQLVSNQALQKLLHDTYYAWFTLLSYYQKHNQHQFLYSYRMDQIDLFEIVQVCNHETTLLELITQFYHDSTYDNYQSILNLLESHLQSVNSRILTNLSLYSNDNLAK